MCPFVTLAFIDNRNGREMHLTVPTSNKTRFRFPSQLAASQPRIFRSVEQLVKAWPLVVVARSDHHDKDSPAFVAVSTRTHHRIAVAFCRQKPVLHGWHMHQESCSIYKVPVLRWSRGCSCTPRLLLHPKFCLCVPSLGWVSSFLTAHQHNIGYAVPYY